MKFDFFSQQIKTNTSTIHIYKHEYECKLSTTVTLSTNTFLGKTAFCPIVIWSVGRRRCRCRCSYKVRQSHISRAVWPRITKFHTNLHTPDMTSLCTSGRKLWTFEKQPKMTPPTASTYNHQNWHIHPYRHPDQSYRIWRHWLLPVGSYCEKTVENAASDGFLLTTNKVASTVI